MATLDIVYSICFQFLDCCEREKLEETWNTEDHSLIGLEFMSLPSESDFVKEVLQKTEEARYQYEEMPESIRQGLAFMAEEWYIKFNGSLKDLTCLPHPWWFTVSTSWRLATTPWMFPKRKKLKDKRARLHVQFN